MDFSIFDVLLDSVFVLGENRQVVYCNEVAASLCDSSVKRLMRGKPIYEFIKFSDESLYSMPEGTAGKDEPFPLVELDFEVLANSKKGKVQVAAQPFEDDGNKLCVLLVRDVTIEEVLHNKHKAQLEQLENYSKNLEKMVEERTAELNSANQMLNAIMNSLGQGFLVFDKVGVCLSIYTKACESILEKVPAGNNIIKVLNLTGADEEQFSLWMQAVFSNSLPFDSLKDLAPKLYDHSKGSHITLDYFPIQESAEQIKNIVLVATDRSAEYEAQRALEREKQYAQMIVKLVSNRKQFANFLGSITHQLKQVSEEAQKVSPDVDYLFRVLHTLEGESATFSVTGIQLASRFAQDILTPARENKQIDFATLSEVFQERIKAIHTEHEQFLMGNKELLKLLNVEKEDVIEVDLERIRYFVDLFKKNGLSEAHCESFMLEMTKRPVSDGVFHFSSVVSQIAERQGKIVSPVEFLGIDIRIDFQRYGDLFGSLVHVFRNIVDHGIEGPEERLSQGKSESGNIKFETKIEKKGDEQYLSIDVLDDGRGIDPDIIRTKYKANQGDSDHEVIQHIFDPGLSSREEAGEYSGRGVGMDAVKSEVSKLDGRVEVFSQLGQGTHLTIIVPLEDTDLELKLGA